MKICSLGFYSLTLLIMLSGWYWVQLPGFSRLPGLYAWGIAADVLILVPILFYSLVYRQHKDRQWPFYFLFSFLFYVGAIYCYLVLPADVDPVRGLAPYYKYLVIAFVLAALLYLICWLLVLSYKFRRSKTRGEKKLRALIMLLPVPAKVKALLKSEFLIWYFALFSRNSNDRCQEGRQTYPDGHFSYHHLSGAPSLIICLVAVMLVETPFSHFIIEQFFSPTISWIKTGLSLYSVIGFLGLAFAMRHKPVKLKNQRLLLQTSLLWRIDIPFNNIDSVTALSWQQQESVKYKRRNICFMSAPSLEIRLKTPQILSGPFGIKQKVSIIWFDLDNKAAFITSLREKININ